MDLNGRMPDQIMQELVQLDHRRMRAMHNLFSEELTRLEFGVMDTIYRHRERHPEAQGIYASEIAEHTCLSRSAVSRQLTQMENRGWILRTVDPQSKRNVFVTLTDSGREALLRQYERGAAFHAAVFERVGEKQVLDFLDATRKITDAMEQEAERIKREDTSKGEHT